MPLARAGLGERPHRVAQTVEHRHGARVLQVCAAEGERIAPFGAGDLIHHALDREDVGRGAETAQRRGPMWQVRHEVLHEPGLGNGVGRVEVAVNPALAGHVRPRCIRFDGVAAEPVGEQACRAGAVGSRPGAATVRPADRFRREARDASGARPVQAAISTAWGGPKGSQQCSSSRLHLRRTGRPGSAIAISAASNAASSAPLWP